MAFAVDAVSGSRPIGTSISRFGRSFRLLSGAALIGAGFAASAWIVATIATAHVMAPLPHPDASPFAGIALAPVHVAATARPATRDIHVTKFSRLGTPTAADKLAAAQKSGRVLAAAALKAAFVGQSAPVIVAEAAPKPVTVATLKTKDDALASIADHGDRIIIPSKAEIAAAEGPALLALASSVEPNERKAAPTAAQPAAPVEVASLSADSDASAGDGRAPFDLVLSDRTDVPLPMARPDGLVKRPATSDRAKPEEPVLAYARPDAGADGSDDDMPTFKTQAPSPVARNGVAIYDISANTVYLPNGERLEAHSGLGPMRDNPKYVHAKNRGPTPPHTYNLTMRESLFHGVAAIRLNPVGGAGNIYNRVGLLAHTYMLGARGDSNGCVSFKDYKRFLAAFKRGDIRQLVVVTSMPRNKPGSTLASLFSSRS
ncbi:DUF2778 domain-containing protein [Rhizobium sp. S152]|uniref:DUF2778 domain-containing protein n=1 Tax=Rhizobium sp. S152 TaxID=3055038 RepID=UPI0025A9A6A0|nr:DUF2778 domain-containing protein [Rhizobium sp. S152]MDM9628609.1 DUF2778 domain-containing protein [Rhizobium sp. S152]